MCFSLTYLRNFFIILSLTYFLLEVKAQAENDNLPALPAMGNASVPRSGNESFVPEAQIAEEAMVAVNNSNDILTNEDTVPVPPTTVSLPNTTMDMVFEMTPTFLTPKMVTDVLVPLPTELMLAVYGVDISLDISSLAESVTDVVCGRRSFCIKSLSAHKKGVCSFECNQCRCDEICQYYGDCCPDVLFKNSPAIPSFPPPIVICLRGVRMTWSGMSSMLVVGRCPEDSNQNETVLRKCHNPDIYDIVQATPVSNLEDKVTYKNLYCAFCNGARDVMAWTQNVRCEMIQVFMRRKSQEDAWRFVIDDARHCQITTNPPPGVIVRGCTPGHVDSCNVTGEWKSPDRKIESMCGLYNHTVRYYGTGNSYTSYRNIFCAICNGINIVTNLECSRSEGQPFPHPLKVLLAFNPPVPLPSLPAAGVPLPRLKKQKKACGKRQAYDTISKSCKDIVCPERRVIGDDGCSIPFSSASGLGFNFKIILIPINGSISANNNYLSKQYFASMNQTFKGFPPAVTHGSSLIYYSKSGFSKEMADLIFIQGTIYTLSSETFSSFENTLLEFMYRPKTFLGPNETKINMSSFPVFCPSPAILSSYKPILGEFNLGSLEHLDPICRQIHCSASFAVEDIGLDCPYFEYNISKENFVFDAGNITIVMDNDVSLVLDKSRSTHCGETVKICLDAVPAIPQELGTVVVDDELHNSVDEMAPSDDNLLTTPNDPVRFRSADSDKTMFIVSLVCITLSLVGLFLTFLVYTAIQKSKSVSSWCTLSVVFHLFWAHLLFLVGASRYEDVTVCRVLGVLVHYFWLAVFAWMVVSAYHMYSFFTKWPPLSSSGITKVNRYVMYFLFSFVTAVFIVTICIGYYLISSWGNDIGYGGRFCFIRQPVGVALFFAAPAGLALLVNAGFFIRTVIAIRSLPNSNDVSNKKNKRRVIIYILLSFLMCISWVFGILAVFLRLEVLWYIYIALTGSQGVFIFLVFCVNRRTLQMIKSGIACGRGSSPSSDGERTENHGKSTNSANSSTYGRFVKRESSSL